MTQFGSAVGWLVLSPIAFITNIIAVVVVCHYHSQFHGTDVAFISLFVSMATHSLLVLPIPAGLAIHDEGWLFSELCSFYVCLVLCVRMSQLLVTVIMNIHWMCILRFTSGQEVYSSATVIKVLVVIAWFASAVTGMVPVLGSSFYTYYEETSRRKAVTIGGSGSNGGATNATVQYYYTAVVRGECKFLPHGIGVSFILFFILATLTILVISVVASADTLAVFRYMRRTAVDKYQAGRFYLPSSSVTVSSSANEKTARIANNQNTGGTSYALRGEADSAERSSLTEQAYGSQGHLHNGGGGVGRGGERTPVVRTPVVGRNGRLAGNHSHVFQGAGPSTPSPEDSEHHLRGGGAGVRGGLPGAENGANSAATMVVRPSAKSGVAQSTPPTVHARYNELNLSSELCRVVLFFTLVTGLLNHLPFVVLQFIQLVQEVDREAAETTVLWLTLTQSLLAPHVLWALSRRYRHALLYTWTVHILRDTSAKEEDSSACTLQSYTRKVRLPEGGTVNVMAKSRGHGPIVMVPNHGNAIPEGQLNGNAVPVRDSSLSDAHSDVSRHREVASGSHVADGTGADRNVRLRGSTEVITTDLDDGMTVITNLASHKVTYIYDQPDGAVPGSSGNERRAPSSPATRQGNDRGVPMSPGGSENSPGNSQGTPSPSKSSLGTPTRSGSDIRRSGSARQVWKKQMRKKHLPAVFINESFEPDEAIRDQQRAESGEVQTQALPDVTRVSRSDVTKRGAAKSDDMPFHYYMSSDFHYDNLRSNSLPRLESESEGGSYQYDDNDIEGILDRDHSIRSLHNTSRLSTFLGEGEENEHPYIIHEDSATDSSSKLAQAAAVSTASDTKTEGREGSRHPHPGTRKPPRRTGVALRQGSRPSLQHQRTVREEPVSEGEEDFAEAAADLTERPLSSASQGSFYPVFESKESDKVGIASSRYGSTEALNSVEETTMDFDEISLSVMPGVLNTAEERLNASDIADTHFDNSSAAVDTNDVYLRIDNVTSDASNSDDVSESLTPGEPSAQRDFSGEDFKPQGQASVLGILLEDGTEILTNPADKHDSSRLHNSNYLVSEPSAPPSFEVDNRNSTLSPTNPFLQDFREDEFDMGFSAAKPPDEIQIKLDHISDYRHPLRFDSENSEMSKIGQDPTEIRDTYDQAENDTYEEFTDANNKKVKGDVMLTRVGSDVQPPDKAMVLDIEETSSNGSDRSVTLEPYHGDRRPPWMDTDFDEDENSAPTTPKRNPFGTYPFDGRSSEDSDVFGSSFGSNAELGTIFENRTPVSRSDNQNPFTFDTFEARTPEDSSDSLQSSGNSEQLLSVRDNNRSGSYQPYPMFDEETDKGFEDALALEHVIGGNPYYGNFGRCFESIEEEPEELSDSLNSTLKVTDEEFKTTIVSCPPSRNSSSSELDTLTGRDPLTSPHDPASVTPFSAATHQVSTKGAESLMTFEEPTEDKDSEPSHSPRVRLTKPSPWPSVDQKRGSFGFDSDFSPPDGFEKHSFGDETDSGNHSANGGSEFSEELHVSFSGYGNDSKAGESGGAAKNGGSDTQRVDSETPDIDPVFF
ncbi:uncharacterized protein [Littorina saxatilis]|uniref:uncharacterized protein n=1 Tax=Littorina saxatilis TaxID=31220 RepID=UPI0038B55004